MPERAPRIVSVSTHDLEGGAARAAFRLHRGLAEAGADARMLVRRKASDDPSVVARGSSGWSKVYDFFEPWVDLWPLALHPGRERGPWSCNWLPGSSTGRALAALRPDLVHLHWVGAGFLPPRLLTRISVPLVWTLHDMWPFTGGCHYDGGCGRYRESCGACPQLGSPSASDVSSRILRRKAKMWAGRRFSLVCPSRWMAGCARQSALFREQRIEVIPNGLDLDRYQPLDKAFCRRLLGVPEDRKLILFGAMAATEDPKKGFVHLEPALRRFAGTAAANGAELLIFGASKPPRPPDFGLPGRYLGRLHDDIALAVLYSAADVMLAPSVQDNLPNTVVESLACGTPVVAFDIGGMPDLIDHGRNGFLARPFEAEGLAEGLQRVLEDPGRLVTLSRRARETAEAKFALPDIARRHLDLYAELLAADSA